MKRNRLLPRPVGAVSAVDASPIRQVLYIVRIRHAERGFTWEGMTFPGHHIYITQSGRVRFESGGCACELARGGVAWFHGDEKILERVIEPWSAYVLHFQAPTLPPPDFEARFFVLRDRDLLARCARLHEDWRRVSVAPLVRQLRVQAQLSEIVADLISPAQQGVHVSRDTSVWWEVEAVLRKDLRSAISARKMGEWVHRSPATIVRSCHRAVGTSPMRRLKQIRLSMARGLVWISRLTFKEIAERIGYSRVHELSRDYRQQFGITPKEDRERYPGIYRRTTGLRFVSGGEEG